MLLESKPKELDFAQEDSILELLPSAPLLSSYQLGWERIQAQYHLQPAWEIPVVYGSHHVIVIYHDVEPTTRTERMLDGRRQCEQIAQGDIVLVPADAPHQSSWDGEKSFILLFLAPADIARIAYEFFDVDEVEILPQFATPDPLIYQIGLLLLSELESNRFYSPLYIDSLTTALSVNLLRRYSARKIKMRSDSGGLPKSKLRRVIEYISEHLAENLSLIEIAEQAQMSPCYLTHLFKQSTGLSVHQFVIHRRIEQAKKLLTKPDLPLVEVSLQVGFQSQSHFINVFRKHAGVTPKAYRQARK